MQSSGSADLPLHHGRVPPWLASRMALLGEAVIETLILEKGTGEALRRLSDPLWFQSLGAVMGMDWHSSGITTSVMGALKRAINPRSDELGLYIAGGKGRFSKQTPEELVRWGERTGQDATALVHYSKLSAKVDNTAIQDGFQLYLHNFIVSKEGEWTVVQQGMSDAAAMARRYHWHSAGVQSFVEAPHTGIRGKNQGIILNMTDKGARPARQAVWQMSREQPERMLAEARKIVLPDHHEVQAKDVNLKRLGATLWLAHEKNPADFEELLMLKGVGPRTLQSLALVSEVIYGTPSRFEDPARFSFAHGGKDGYPFPVPLKTYDETLEVLKTSIDRSKLGYSDKAEALKNLSKIAERAEKGFTPNADFEKVVEKERRDSWKYGGRTVKGKAQKPKDDDQLRLF